MIQSLPWVVLPPAPAIASATGNAPRFLFCLAKVSASGSKDSTEWASWQAGQGRWRAAVLVVEFIHGEPTGGHRPEPQRWRDSLLSSFTIPIRIKIERLSIGKCHAGNASAEPSLPPVNPFPQS